MTSPARSATLLPAIRTAALLVALPLLATTAGCGYDGPMLTVHELKAGLDDTSRTIHVLDVRPPSQYAKGHVPGAINLPLEKLGEKTEDITALEGEIAVICNCGKGALAAAKQLQGRGIPAALVKGGYKEWTAARYPIKKHLK